MTDQDIYGPHAALLHDCYVTVYSDGRPERHLTLRHGSGITVQVTGTSDIMMKRAALDELVGKLKAEESDQ